MEISNRASYLLRIRSDWISNEIYITWKSPFKTCYIEFSLQFALIINEVLDFLVNLI